MFTTRKSKNKTSSRQQIAIDEIRDGIIMLPGNQYRSILEVSALNFELKSEAEQDAIIDTYESFLNSLGTGIQIVVRTREVDIDQYIFNLRLRLVNEDIDSYRTQLENYIVFISSLVHESKILSRRFYVVVSHAGESQSDFDLVQEQLNQKLDIATKGLGRLGIHAVPLSSLESIDLFYSFYNPIRAKFQPFTEQALQLTNDFIVKKEAS